MNGKLSSVLYNNNNNLIHQNNGSILINLSMKVENWEDTCFPSSPYGCETWTIKEGEKKKFAAFEMWCWRCMLRIPWTARHTNPSIWKQLDVEPEDRV